MNRSPKKRKGKLPVPLKISLFCTSYVPLFLIIILKQLLENSSYFHYGGLNRPAVIAFISNFSIALILFALSLYGIWGMIIFLKNMRTSVALSGHTFKIEKIQNKNNESIGYIATYLVPFMFQSFSSVFEVSSFLLLLCVMYVIYTHSTLIIVNPLLSLKYSLYDIEYIDIKSGMLRQGTFIVDCHNVEQGDCVNAKSLGSNLYYAVVEDCNNE